MISPTTTNEFIFTYNHLTQVVDVTEDADTSLYDRDKLGFTFKELYPAVNVRNKFPRFNCGVGPDCNFPGFASGWLSEGKTFAWTDNFTRVHGAHTFKTGVFFNRNDNGQQPAWTDSINLNFGPNRENPERLEQPARESPVGQLHKRYSDQRHFLRGLQILRSGVLWAGRGR